jgi:hypothetical protein
VTVSAVRGTGRDSQGAINGRSVGVVNERAMKERAMDNRSEVREFLTSPAADALTLLASWAATVDQEQQADQERQTETAPTPDGT